MRQLVLFLVLAAPAGAAEPAPFGGLFQDVCRSYGSATSVPPEFLLRRERVGALAWHTLPRVLPDLRADEISVLREIVPSWVPPGDMNGVDLLRYNHARLTSAFRAAGGACAAPWRTPPDADRRPAMPKGFSQSLYLQLRAELDTLRDPAWLRAHSLRELGEEVKGKLLPDLRRAYAGDPTAGWDDCAFDVDNLISGRLRAGHCEDPRNSWLGSPATEAANPVYLVELAASEQALTAWVEAHGKKVTSAGIDALFLAELGREPWAGGDDFEADFHSGVERVVKKRLKSERSANAARAPEIRADLRMRVEHVFRVLNQHRTFEP